LLHAVMEGRESDATRFIGEGANVNGATADGGTLLHIAASNENERAVRWLLEHQAHVDAANQTGIKPLSLAVREGNVPITDLLLTHGATVDQASVFIATNENYLAVLDLLLGCYWVQSSATQDAKNKALLVMAKKQSNPALYRALVAGANPDSQNERLHTPLHFAASQGNVRSAKDLLAYRARTNIPNSTCNMPLHFACWKGHTELAKMLIGAGAPLNAKNGNGDTPLHFAAGYGHLPIVKALAERGALATEKNGEGKDPEVIAATPEIKQYLKDIKTSYFAIGLMVAYLNFINRMSRV